MDKETIDQNRLIEIVKKRLLRVPEEIKKFLPPILSKPGVDLFTFLTDTYFILAFVDAAEKEKLKNLVKKGHHPFPGLIKPENVSMSAAFRLERARNTFIAGCTVEDMFSFSLGKDSTIILLDHKQSWPEETGVYIYVIDLAYIVSFGDEINRDNLYDFLEDLIAYSFKEWRSS